MTLDVIGQKLKSTREAQGLTLRQIYERTKIPINHLQAIDNGMPDDLPESVYVAGFIKRYAECIGLDGQTLADEYRRENGNGNGNGKPKAQPQQVYVTPEYLKHTRIDNRAPSYKLWVFPLIGIGLVLLFLSWYYKQYNNASSQDPNILSLRESVSHMPGPSATTTATTTAAGSDQNVTSADNKVVITATKHVWVEVKRLSSGETLYTGFLEQGDKRDFQEPQGLRVTAGNGGSLSVEFKGKIEPFGENGKRSERTFTPPTPAVVNGSTSTTSDKPATTQASSAGSTSATTAAMPKPKKVRKPVDTTTARTPSPGRPQVDSSGTRSIPGEDGGTHSLDVPYRY